jgi:rod shape-determining protein MreB
MALSSIFRWFSKDLAIDLGTANTLIYVKGEGIVCNEPSVVAVGTDARAGRRILAVGTEAKKMLDRTPGFSRRDSPAQGRCHRRLAVAQSMLRYFIEKTNNRRYLARPRIVICAPSGIGGIERRALREAAEAAGAREVPMLDDAWQSNAASRDRAPNTCGLPCPTGEPLWLSPCLSRQWQFGHSLLGVR